MGPGRPFQGPHRISCVQIAEQLARTPWLWQPAAISHPIQKFHRSSPPPSITDIIYYMYMVLYTCSDASIFQHTWLYPSQQDVTPVNYLLSRFRYPDLTNMCVDCRTHQQLWQLCPLIISHLGTCSDRDHRSGTQGFFLQQVFEPLVSFSSFMLVNVLDLELRPEKQLRSLLLVYIDFL